MQKDHNAGNIAAQVALWHQVQRYEFHPVSLVYLNSVALTSVLKGQINCSKHTSIPLQVKWAFLSPAERAAQTTTLVLPSERLWSSRWAHAGALGQRSSCPFFSGPVGIEQRRPEQSSLCESSIHSQDDSRGSGNASSMVVLGCGGAAGCHG